MGDTGFMDRHRGRVAFDHAVVASLRGGSVIATLSAAYTMPDEGMTYFLDAGGAARNVILPAAADNLGTVSGCNQYRQCCRDSKCTRNYIWYCPCHVRTE